MSSTFDRPLVAELRHGLTALRGNWFWFVLLGVALIALGFIALSAVAIASIATAMTIGVLILLGGIAETVGAFWCRAWSGFFLHMLTGVLSIVVGLMFLRATGRFPGGPDASHCLLFDGRRHLQDRGGLELPVCALGMAAGKRRHRLGSGRVDLDGTARVGPLGHRIVRGNQPVLPGRPLDRPRLGLKSLPRPATH